MDNPIVKFEGKLPYVQFAINVFAILEKRDPAAREEMLMELCLEVANQAARLGREGMRVAGIEFARNEAFTLPLVQRGSPPPVYYVRIYYDTDRQGMPAVEIPLASVVLGELRGKAAATQEIEIEGYVIFEGEE